LAEKTIASRDRAAPRRRPSSNHHGRWGIVYAAPAIVLVAAFVAYPFASIAAHSLTRWDGITPAQYVGFHNFRVLWGDHVFRLALRNNFLFALSVPIQVVVPLLVAYAIHLRIPGWRLFRATVFLPAVYATVVIGILASTALQLDGPINDGLGKLGLPRWSVAAIVVAFTVICIIAQAFLPIASGAGGIPFGLLSIFGVLTTLFVAAGLVLGRMASQGSRCAGDLAVAIFVGYAIGQWMPRFF
jgi:ABC-type sugar transport system permease subunit